MNATTRTPGFRQRSVKRGAPLLIVLVAVALLGGLPWLLKPKSDPTIPPTRPEAPPLSGLQGVASCTASACHGVGSPGAEWVTWSRLDPHARAYDVLLEKSARQIEEKLNPGKGQPRPEQNEVCLNCHVAPGVMQTERSPHFDLRDGVGCESCHGPSGKWLREHARPGWVRSESSGMKDMRDLRVRVEVCMPCHVGKGDMQVDHDLIAAGHPRLRFEFAAYLANYPPHWPASKDRQRYPDLEARAWVVGELAGADAALQLLTHRAKSGTGLWPELAEYDCYACHHDLAPRSWRQQQVPAGATPGRLIFNDWYFASLPAIAPGFDVGPLAEVMSSPNPDRSRAADLAQAQLARLAQARAALSPKPLDMADRMTLLGRLADLERSSARRTWDRDTQWYLGAAALTAASPHGPPGIRQPVQGLNSLMNQAFRAGKGDSLASPRGYEPDAGQRLWQEIRDRLKK
jgi:hypothetical protein